MPDDGSGSTLVARLGRPKGPDSGAEVSLGVVRCHLGDPEGGTRYCGWATPPHFFRGAGIAPGGPGRLGHETRQGSLHVALKSVVVRPELGDLNVIIQVEEWHSPGAAIGSDSGPEVALGVKGTLDLFRSPGPRRPAPLRNSVVSPGSKRALPGMLPGATGVAELADAPGSHPGGITSATPVERANLLPIPSGMQGF